MTIENGEQNPAGGCSTTIIGEVPSEDHMISTVILFPKDGATLVANEPFTVRIKTINLSSGSFSDPTKQYGTLPQKLDEHGLVEGHSHVTIQKIDDDNVPLDPQKVAFFEGLNSPADNFGELTANVDKGLPVGRYRACTVVSTSTHNPVAMPVAKRGAQDDCVRFTVENQH